MECSPVLHGNDLQMSYDLPVSLNTSVFVQWPPHEHCCFMHLPQIPFVKLNSERNELEGRVSSAIKNESSCANTCSTSSLRSVFEWYMGQVYSFTRQYNLFADVSAPVKAIVDVAVYRTQGCIKQRYGPKIFFLRLCLCTAISSRLQHKLVQSHSEKHFYKPASL